MGRALLLGWAQGFAFMVLGLMSVVWLDAMAILHGIAWGRDQPVASGDEPIVVPHAMPDIVYVVAWALAGVMLASVPVAAWLRWASRRLGGPAGEDLDRDDRFFLRGAEWLLRTPVRCGSTVAVAVFASAALVALR